MTLGERYRVVEVLARGATSTVYLCDDLRLSGARWAVKLADPTGLGPGASARQLFDREAELLARLSHPLLPRLVDRFIHEGQPALVLELVAGPTLAQRGLLSQAETVRVGRELADLLCELHRQDILLVDLSPSNVLLAPDGRPRLVDLGLARTGPGPTAGGTPGFTAPETHQTTASDVYALGALLKASLGRRGTPRLRALLERCTDSDPTRRPSLTELRQDLQADPAAVSAESVPRAAVLAAALLLLASLSSLTAGLLAWRPPPERLAVQAWEALLAGERTRAGLLAARILEQDPSDPEGHILARNATLDPEAVVLPLIVPVTGPEWREGRAFLQGAALAQQTSPRPVFLRVCDDGGQVDRAMSWVEELSRDERVFCVLGPTSSERSLAVDLVAARLELPVLSLGASHPRAWDNAGWLFTVGVPYEARVAPLAREFRSRGFRKAWLLYDPQQVMARDLAFAIKSQLGPVREQVYSTASQDFRELVRAMVQERADAVFFVAAPGSYLGEFAVQLRAAGSQAALYSNVSGYTEGLRKAGGPALEGLRLSETFFPGSEQVKAFEQGFRKLFPGVEPGRSSAQAYDAVQLVVNGPPARESLRQHLSQLGVSLPAYPGISAPLSTGRIPKELPVYLLEVSSGHEQLLREEPPATP